MPDEHKYGESESSRLPTYFDKFQLDIFDVIAIKTVSS